METYQEITARHSKEYGEIEGIFYAFSNEQAAKGMEKIGLKRGQEDQVRALGSGGYILASKVPELKALIKRHVEETEAFQADKERLTQALEYELANHEYCYTHDPGPALEALGLESVDSEILREAKRRYYTTLDPSTV